MEAFKKQASKFREQVARQQQAVLKQFGAGYGEYDNTFTEEELQQLQRLEKLHLSTRTAKHFQRNLFRGVEGYIVNGYKYIETGKKLSEDSQKYGSKNTCTSGNTLSKAALYFSRALSQIEKERGILLNALAQVAESLKTMINGAPLEDARILAQRYSRVKEEVEAQVAEVWRRQMRARESLGNADIFLKLESAESKLQELKSSMGFISNEAVTAMSSVETEQQRATLEKLITVVEAERAYHQRVLQILDQLEREMVSECQRIEGAPHAVIENSMQPPPSYEEASSVYKRPVSGKTIGTIQYFLAEAIQSFQAESEAELDLSVGDFLVVRKVSNSGWAEGECGGKAGWFPCNYVERRERVLASKVAHIF